MKPRRVIVTIEMDTIAPVSELRVRDLWWHALASAKYGWEPEIRKLMVSIIKPEKGGKQA